MAQCKFTCPHCNFEHVVGEAARGRHFPCARCSKPLIVDRSGIGCRSAPELPEMSGGYTWEKDLATLGGGILPTVTDENLREFVAHVHAVILACRRFPKHGNILRRVLWDLLCEEPEAAATLPADRGPEPAKASPGDQASA